MSNIRLGLLTVGLIALFFLVRPFVAYSNQIEVINSLILGASIAIVASWGPAAWQALKHEKMPGRILMLGVTSVFVSVVALRLWAIVLRSSDKPALLLDSPVAAFLLYITMLSTFLFLLAPGELRGIIPITNWRWVVFAVGLGGVIAGLAIGLLL